MRTEPLVSEKDHNQMIDMFPNPQMGNSEERFWIQTSQN